MHLHFHAESRFSPQNVWLTLAVILVVLLVLGCGGWTYYRYESNMDLYNNHP
jgi:hypothetical protein